MSIVTRQYRYSVSTEPSVEPVTVGEAKIHLRVSNTDDDAYITTLITAARKNLEIQMRRAFVNTTYKLQLDEFPEEIVLPGGTLQSVTHLKYYDEDGVQQTWTSSNYLTDVYSVPGKLVRAPDIDWPSIQERTNAIEIQYVAGYGAAASNVPADIRQAILIMVAHFYEHREPIITGTIVSDVPMAVQTIITSNKIQEFF